MEDIFKILKSLEDSGLLLEGISETIKDEAEEQKGRFLSIFLSTLEAILLANMLAENGVMRAGEETVRVGYGSKRYSFNKKFWFHHIL